MACGIYKIVNKINGKIYIGSSRRLKARRAEHKYRRKNYKGNSAILSAILKYGEESFYFEVIEEFHFGEFASNIYIDEILSSREQYYIDVLNPEYNIRKTDVTRSTGVCSEKQRKHLQRISKYNRNRSGYKRPIYQIDKEGKVIKEFRCAEDAGKELNLDSGAISRVLSGEYKHTKYYFFKYKLN